jgi:hypothetical protein
MSIRQFFYRIQERARLAEPQEFNFSFYGSIFSWPSYSSILFYIFRKYKLLQNRLWYMFLDIRGPRMVLDAHYLSSAWDNFLLNCYFYAGLLDEYYMFFMVTYGDYVSKSKKKKKDENELNVTKPSEIFLHTVLEVIPSFFVFMWYFIYFSLVSILPCCFKILLFWFSWFIRFLFYLLASFLFFFRFLFVVCVEALFRVFKVLVDFIRLFFSYSINLFSALFLFFKFSLKKIDIAISKFLLNGRLFSRFKARIFLFYKYDFTLTNSIGLKIIFFFLYSFLLFFWFLLYVIFKSIFMVYFTLYFFFLSIILKCVDFGVYDFFLFIVSVYKLIKYEW